ncbi:MAG: hypothetical protein NVS9B1_22880 [Candidatus Dormibacteraceae bacterium]
MNEFFDDLGRRWVKAAADRGAEIASPELDPAMAAELLDLAGVTAHTQERRFAPLACYVAGIAAERLRAGRPDIGSSELVAYVNEVRRSLEGPE